MYEYKAEILSIYDGDGVYKAIVDMGMGIKVSKHIRLFGVDTPELRGDQLQAGRIVRDLVGKLLIGKTVTIKTKKDKSGKYGRLLANVIIHGTDLGSYLIDLGYAKPYFGGKKEAWTKEQLERIIDESRISGRA